MSFADPQTIKISGTETSLPRTSVGQGNSTYTSADGLKVARASTTDNGKRLRQTLRLDLTKIAASLFQTTTNERQSMSCYVVFDRPSDKSWTDAEAKAVWLGFLEKLATEAQILKLLGGES